MSSSTPPKAPTAAIVVRDEALAASLLFLLQTCRVEAVISSARAAPEASFLFVDHQPDGLTVIARLRALGWSGLAVLLIEDAHAAGAPQPIAGRMAVLEKPFTARQITAIVGAT